MPVYEYRCRNCNHQFEIQQAFSDDALTVCPECEGPLRKVFAPVGITFKGSGFYKNDSRSSTSSTTPAGDSSGGSSSSASGESSSSGSGDSKPAATSSTSSSD